jgi:predicted outer membrane repeat protein
VNPTASSLQIQYKTDGPLRVPGDFPTIQTAIDSAASGDTVLVASGTYTGPGNRDINFGGKNIVLMSEEGADSTIIDCQGLGRGIIFQSDENDTATVDGFQITNGLAASDSGGGIYITEGSSPTIRNTRLVACDAYLGGGAYAVGGTFRNCVFANNDATTDGGGIYVNNAFNRVLIDSCTFTNNVASRWGGGVHARDDSLASVTNSWFLGNLAGSRGGGISVRTGLAVIANTMIRGDSSSLGGGLAFGTGSYVDVTNCVLDDNGAIIHGGAVYIGSNSVADFVGCDFTNNRAINDGGGVYGHSDGFTVTFDDCEFLRNTAGDAGGAMGALSGLTEFVDCRIKGNLAGTSGGALAFGQNAPMSLLGCVVTGNRSDGDGGALYLMGLTVTPWAFTLTSTTISSNYAAQNGGGVYFEVTGSGDTLRFDQAILRDNCAAISGSELASDGALPLEFICSNVDSSGVDPLAFYDANTIFGDPLFCGAVPCTDAPTTGGEYTLDDDSPALAANSPCGQLIGAEPQGCTGRVFEVVSGGPFATIQDAIDETVSGVGDTVLVADSTWTGPRNTAIDFGGRNIVLKSESGPATAVIDGGDSVRAIIFQNGEDTTAVVDGFTFTRGAVALPGSAVLVDSSGPVIKNCIIKGNTGAAGVVRVVSGSPVFAFCTIEEDTATITDGVLAFVGGSPRVVSCLIQNNAAANAVTVATPSTFLTSQILDNSGRGIYFDSTPSSIVTTCDISRNFDRGVVLHASSVSFTGVVFRENGGGGVTVTGLGAGPFAPSSGRDISASASAVTNDFYDCEFSGHSADRGAGFFFDCANEPEIDYTVTFTNCRFTGNHATFEGGGVAMCGRATSASIVANFTNCTIAANNAQDGGGIYMGVTLVGSGREARANFDRTILWGNCSTTVPQGEAFVDTDNELDFGCSHMTYDEIAGAGLIDTAQVSTGIPAFCDYPALYYTTDCQPEASIEGDFALSADSPAAPEQHPCGGLVGAFPAISCVATAVPGAPRLPVETSVRPPAPNPFNPVTTVEFSLATESHVTLRIYDIKGRLVRTLADRSMPQARYRARWDGLDNRGNRVASGVYFMRFAAGKVVETHKMVLLK